MIRSLPRLLAVSCLALACSGCIPENGADGNAEPTVDAGPLVFDGGLYRRECVGACCLYPIDCERAGAVPDFDVCRCVHTCVWAGTTCTAGQPMPDGLACRDDDGDGTGRCYRVCASNTECAPDRACVDGLCVTPRCCGDQPGQCLKTASHVFECVPLAARGESCERVGCQPNLRCLDQICTSTSELGEPCGESKCLTPWVCVAGVCAERPRLGDVCEPGQCAYPGVCVEGTCTSEPEAGQPCAANNRCAVSALCVDGVCTPRPDIGESCIEGLCATDLRCVDGVCALGPGVGEPCQMFWCQPELICVEGVCTDPGQLLDPNMFAPECLPFTGEDRCGAPGDGLWCSPWGRVDACVPDPGGRAQLGDACGRDSPCATPDGGAPGPLVCYGGICHEACDPSAFVATCSAAGATCEPADPTVACATCKAASRPVHVCSR